MTPLAMKIFRQMAMPAARSQFSDDNMFAELREPHCFEATEVIPLLDIIDHQPSEAVDAAFFLPAPETWIEWHAAEVGRQGIYLKDHADGIHMFRFNATRSVFVCRWTAAHQWADPNPHASVDHIIEHWRIASCFLAAINTPRLIGRREHQPHRGLERELSKTSAPLELRPWTEIKLEILPQAAGKGGVAVPQLVGKRCLHFCRSHLRVQANRLVVVRSHWRGDAALGLKQSTYRVSA